MLLNIIMCGLLFLAIPERSMASGPDCAVKLPTRATKFVDEVIKASDPKTLDSIKASNGNDLIQFHHSYGMWIRNKWLRNSKSSQQIIEAVTGNKKSDLDSASQRTIEYIWCRLVEHRA